MDHPTANAPAAASASEGLLPFLHDAVLTLCAPSPAISRADGQLDGGAAGFCPGDRRVSAQLTVASEGITLAPVDGGLRGANRAEFRSLLRASTRWRWTRPSPCTAAEPSRPYDTALALHGLTGAGFPDAAASLAEAY
ncbi:hypothetical protein [Streptomyces hirsutus]|uniref:hypothetical protein n=1 Tax=Streptomyces hirsutus TaxID=35620 RepID=UPI0034025A51